MPGSTRSQSFDPQEKASSKRTVERGEAQRSQVPSPERHSREMPFCKNVPLANRGLPDRPSRAVSGPAQSRTLRRAQTCTSPWNRHTQRRLLYKRRGSGAPRAAPGRGASRKTPWGAREGRRPLWGLPSPPRAFTPKGPPLPLPSPARGVQWAARSVTSRRRRRAASGRAGGGRRGRGGRRRRWQPVGTHAAPRPAWPAALPPPAAAARCPLTSGGE